MGYSGLSKEKEEALRKKMEELGIQEKDIQEKFIRSSGKGGQRLNKTATCVYLKHVPTGIEVKCQKERYQALNRFLARRILAEKVEAFLAGKRSAEEQRREKIRRQKRTRTRRAKRRMLEEKRKHGEKKKDRSFRPSSEDLET